MIYDSCFTRRLINILPSLIFLFIMQTQNVFANENSVKITIPLAQTAQVKNIPKAFMDAEKLSKKFYVHETTNWTIGGTESPQTMIKVKIKPDINDVLGATRPAPRIPLRVDRRCRRGVHLLR